MYPKRLCKRTGANFAAPTRIRSTAAQNKLSERKQRRSFFWKQDKFYIKTCPTFRMNFSFPVQYLPTKADAFNCKSFTLALKGDKGFAVCKNSKRSFKKHLLPSIARGTAFYYLLWRLVRNLLRVALYVCEKMNQL